MTRNNPGVAAANDDARGIQEAPRESIRRRPSEQEERARKAEVAMRYRKRRGPPDLKNWRWGQLYRLYRHRHPDEPASHTRARVDSAFENARDHSASGLGDFAEITAEEKINLVLKNLDAYDEPKHKVQAKLAALRRAADAARKRRKRAAKPKPEPESARAAAVLAVLRETMRLQDIADAVRTHPAFDCLTDDAMRQALHRAVLDLVAVGRAEKQTVRIATVPFRITVVRPVE